MTLHTRILDWNSNGSNLSAVSLHGDLLRYSFFFCLFLFFAMKICESFFPPNQGRCFLEWDVKVDGNKSADLTVLSQLPLLFTCHFKTAYGLISPSIKYLRFPYLLIVYRNQCRRPSEVKKISGMIVAPAKFQCRPL